MPLLLRNQIWQSLEEGAGKRCSLSGSRFWCTGVAESIAANWEMSVEISTERDVKAGPGLRTTPSDRVAESEKELVKQRWSRPQC